ncbi:alpha/beta hydrolase [Streptoalloteichus hindustanus]|uniref:Alpha/beta hydrolase family protein n=1 Tax=Streptoalloteichus hindustanus TaxID=2017 RepID=A0A1M5FHL5_STRHI|nr:alpha/beta hydrolase family protein [Streptoalloteichus hindustanus]SHF91067.1 Alpha/beta hydrolase family protein [Streptoalloteichus hindustanus]
MAELSRRGFLGTALVGAGAGGGRELGRRGRPTFVLVHGANGNAGYFAPLVAELAMAGHRALAVDLPGHGPAGHFPPSYQAPQDLAALAAAPSPLAGLRLADNVDHVTRIVRRVAAHGPVILVGHSMGGATITRVGNEIPHLIARLVYLTAFCCVRLRSVLECFTATPEGRTSLLTTIPGLTDPGRTGVTRTNWRCADRGFLAAAKAALAGGWDDAAFLAALNTMEPDEAWAVTTDDARGVPATWGRIPRTYVRCARDRAVPLPLQDRMISEADRATPHNRFDVHTLDAPHLGPQHPRPLARVLTSLLD